MKKNILIIFTLVLLILFGIGAKLFLIGEPMDDDSLAVRVEEGDGQVTIYIQSTDSAMAISNLKYHYEGTVMHLTPWKVLCSPIHNDGDKCLYYEIVDETEIWVGEKLIWSAK